MCRRFWDPLILTVLNARSVLPNSIHIPQICTLTHTNVKSFPVTSVAKFDLLKKKKAEVGVSLRDSIFITVTHCSVGLLKFSLLIRTRQENISDMLISLGSIMTPYVCLDLYVVFYHFISSKFQVPLSM